MIKRMIVCLLAGVLLFSLSLSVFADDSRSYEIALSVNGSHEVQAKPGDVLTVTMTLKRTDSGESAAMYAMQDEIRYDPAFFEVVQGSTLMMNGVEVTDIGLIDEYRAFYVNFLSLGGGEEWATETLLGSFQLKVLGDKGSSMLKNENCIVSTKDGKDSYPVSGKDLLVVVSSECTVSFDSMGGSPVPEQSVRFGEKIKKPEDPSREGYIFAGWYRDIFLKDAWDFDNDMVQDNMTLYAAWQQGELVEAEAPSFPWWILLLIAVVLLLLWMFRRNWKKEAK